MKKYILFVFVLVFSFLIAGSALAQLTTATTTEPISIFLTSPSSGYLRGEVDLIATISGVELEKGIWVLTSEAKNETEDISLIAKNECKIGAEVTTLFSSAMTEGEYKCFIAVWDTTLLSDGKYEIWVSASPSVSEASVSSKLEGVYKSEPISVVIDNTLPVITIDPYNTDFTNQDIKVTASTNEGELNASSYLFTKNGSFTFIAKDLAGNITEKTVTINNIDREAPVLKLLGENPVSVARGSFYRDAGYNVTDNLDNIITVKMEPVTINTNEVGEHTITYTATDRAGNSATISRTVNVIRVRSGGSSSGGSYIAPVISNPIVANPMAGQVLGAEKFNFTLWLKYGSRGNEVMELQKFLNNAGHDCGIADGIFGPKTKAAVIKFQLANGLAGDSIVGPLTRAVLNK